MADWLVVTEGPAAGTRLEVGADMAVGRLQAPPADLGGDRELSRAHARFWRAARGQLLVEDLGSANGTFVNGERIDRPCLLTDGDRVGMGATTLVFSEDKPTQIRVPTEARSAPRPDPAPPAPGPAPAPAAGSPPAARSPTRLVILLSAALVLTAVGLIVSLLTRGTTTSRPVPASVPVVSPIFPVTSLKFSGELASFKLNAPRASVGAVIDWGDGTPPTPGTLGPPAPSGNGTYTRKVSGSHTYTRTATYSVTVTVKPTRGDPQSGSNLAVVTTCFCVDRLPTFSRFVDLGPVSGAVRVKPLGSGVFVPLTAPLEVPVGSHVDTTHGTVVVMAGTATAGKLAAGEFDGGVFQLLQPPAMGGLVQLNLQGANAATCRPGQQLSGTVLSLLHASVNGSFRTRGTYSSATVRGTEWTTAEQCDGTLTRVERGVVDVQNLRTGATVAVSAGESYLASAR